MLREALKADDFFVAADGAAQMALALGRVPDAVIGDFDSLDAATRARLPASILHHVAEQDSTDFEKCLTRIAAPVVLCFGFTGARLDHELAVYNVIARTTDKTAIVIGAEDICLHVPRGISLALPVGTRVSLFPMAAVTGRSDGLEWPIAGLSFAPDGRIGTSNRTVAPEIHLDFDQPGMLLILPKEHLATVRAAL